MKIKGVTTIFKIVMENWILEIQFINIIFIIEQNQCLNPSNFEMKT